MPTNADTLVSLAGEVFPDLREAETTFLRLNAVGGYPVVGDGTSELDKPENADQWGPDRTIRADCLRWLCRAQNIRPLLQSIRVRAVGVKKGTLHLDYALIPLYWRSIVPVSRLDYLGKSEVRRPGVKGDTPEEIHLRSRSDNRGHCSLLERLRRRGPVVL